MDVNELSVETLAAIFEDCRDEFIRTISSRLDPRLCSRIDPSDVLQEAFIAANLRLPNRKHGTPIPALVWVRLELDQAIAQAHRYHFRRKRTPAGGVRPIDNSCSTSNSEQPEGISLASSDTSPSGVAIRKETSSLVKALIVDLSPTDRSILAMRHFECLTNQDCAKNLGISPKAASERYRRALLALERSLRKSANRKD